MTDTHPVTERREGWIEWSGGENPVGDVLIEVRLRSGASYIAKATHLRFAHSFGQDFPAWSPDTDIVAYRVVSAAPNTQAAVDGEGVRTLMLALEDFLNEPRRGRDESPDVRDYRHEAYRVWSPLCAALSTPPASVVGSGSSSPKSEDTHRATDGAVVGLEQWGWRLRSKASDKHGAGPWHWQPQAMDSNTAQFAEAEPVFVRQAAISTAEQPGIRAADEPSPPPINADPLEALRRVRDLDTRPHHDGYDDGPGGGNFIYRDVIFADEAFPIIDGAIAKAQASGGAS